MELLLNVLKMINININVNLNTNTNITELFIYALFIYALSKKDKYMFLASLMIFAVIVGVRKTSTILSYKWAIHQQDQEIEEKFNNLDYMDKEILLKIMLSGKNSHYLYDPELKNRYSSLVEQKLLEREGNKFKIRDSLWKKRAEFLNSQA